VGLLTDRKLLITGVLSNRSIAYGVAKACQREGAALAFTYVNDDLKDRVTRLAGDFGTCPVLPCDVTSDEQIAALFDALRGEWAGSTASCIRSRSRRAKRWPATTSRA
jgi:enoyl-[acyl-carrier protein] reductase I